MEQITAHGEQLPEAAGTTAKHQVPPEEKGEAQSPSAVGTVLPDTSWKAHQKKTKHPL